jgi:prephenate dehydrogenase
MTGSEKNGYLAGTAHLFENAYYIITTCKSSSEAAICLIENMVRGFGAIPVRMDAVKHDRIIGAISHVPHVVASALVSLAMKTGDGDKMIRLLAAGGFRDITRIASSSPVMWENIVFSNKIRINELLETFIDILNEYKAAMASGNSEGVLNFFAETKEFRDSLPSVSTGLIQPEFLLVVDVEDKPGIIGEIATLLGKNNINIKNINVSNSREFEQGCLRITLPDPDSANIGFDLLMASGYKVYMNK